MGRSRKVSQSHKKFDFLALEQFCLLSIVCRQITLNVIENIKQPLRSLGLKGRGGFKELCPEVLLLFYGHTNV